MSSSAGKASTLALPPHVLKNLGEKLYEKRKAGALDIEQMTKKLVASGQSSDIRFLIQKLAGDFARSPVGNQRKGALLGLAAVACGLTHRHIKEYLPEIIPTVLESVTDQDSRVRFYAVEALYNIADIARDAMLPFMIQAFDGLFRVSADADDHLRSAVPYAENLLKDIACHSPDFDIASFVQQLAPRMDSIKPYNRRFILGWIEALAGSTMIDILVFLPDLLDGLLSMLSDKMAVLVLRKAEEKSNATTGGSASQAKSASNAGVVFPGAASGGKVIGSAGNEFQPQEIRHLAADVLAQLLQYVWDQGGGDADIGLLLDKVLLPRAEDQEEAISVKALQWTHTFIKLSVPEEPFSDSTEAAQLVRMQLLPHFHCILHALLSCICSASPAVRDLAGEINLDLLKLRDPASWQHISMEDMLSTASDGLRSQQEETRLLALRWINFLLNIKQEEVLLQVDDLLPALLNVMIGPSDKVVLESLAVQAAFAASTETHFKQYISRLVGGFQAQQGAELLQRRGSMVLRRLCTLLGAERCFIELAERLAEQTNLQYASTMVQALNLILLTAPETKDMRKVLQTAPYSSSGRQLFLVLYKSWAHSPGALLTLCFLAQAYDHAAVLIDTFGEIDWDIDVVVQLDRVVRLLEAPVFTFLRLHILKPAVHPSLLQALYGLLMLLPQGEAFKLLSARLNAVPVMGLMQLSNGSPAHAWSAEAKDKKSKDKSKDKEDSKLGSNEDNTTRVDFQKLLRYYKELQEKHVAEIELRKNRSLDGFSDGVTSQTPSEHGARAPGPTLEDAWKLANNSGHGSTPEQLTTSQRSETVNEWGW